MRPLLLIFSLLGLHGSELCIFTLNIANRPAPRVPVSLLRETHTVAGGETSELGKLCFPDLQPGTYEVRVQPTSYFPVTIHDVDLRPAAQVALPAMLLHRTWEGIDILDFGDTAKVWGAVDEKRFRTKVVRICHGSGTSRMCHTLSRWGEYRFEVPLGKRHQIELEDARGNILCSESFEERFAGDYSLKCGERQ